MSVATPQTCTHLLLDIEGTTCPVDYVAGTLFPYAAAALNEFLKEHGGDTEVQALIEQIRKAWEEDNHEQARTLYQQHAKGSPHCTPYIHWLIRKDRKLTPLKSLQGKIWNLGYRKGDLQAPLFRDISAALQRLKHQGIILASYSSGSIEAQHLLYQYSKAGNLKPLFSHWFDTTTGPKKDPKSYKKISEIMNAESDQVTFISDANAELHAARTVGMNAVFSDRPGNPETSSEGFSTLQSLTNLMLS